MCLIRIADGANCTHERRDTLCMDLVENIFSYSSFGPGYHFAPSVRCASAASKQKKQDARVRKIEYLDCLVNYSGFSLENGSLDFVYLLSRKYLSAQSVNSPGAGISMQCDQCRSTCHRNLDRLTVSMTRSSEKMLGFNESWDYCQMCITESNQLQR